MKACCALIVCLAFAVPAGAVTVGVWHRRQRKARHYWRVAHRARRRARAWHRRAQRARRRLTCTRGRVMVATAYGPPWGGIEGSGVTATGVPLRPGLRVIAVDPAVIPLGSRLRVWPNPLGTRRTFTAADTGGAIRGGRIDVFDWHGPAAMSRWGIRQVHVCNTTKEKP